MSPRQRNPPDPRHGAFRVCLEEYWAAERNEAVPDLPWGAGEAGALGAFLRANPKLSAEGFARLLQHRLASDDHARGESPKVWLGALTRYANGPLDRFKLPKERRNDATRADERHRNIASATGAALDRVRRMADR